MAQSNAPLVIVGGGPAGMMAGLLFARAGVPTIVLEKHADFLRDFRGDTVHPSTLESFRELGLLDRLLSRPHNRVTELSARVAGRTLRVADFTRLPIASKFIALMPQWEFLDFLKQEAGRYPNFAIRMKSEARELVFDENGRVSGVRLASGEPLRSRLVIAADGRRSLLRKAAALPIRNVGAPIDVLWFRLPRTRVGGSDTVGIIAPGHMLVLIDRGDYWQAAYVISKGTAEVVRGQGLSAFRAALLSLAPELKDAVAALAEWDQVKLLSVALDRLDRWHCPGLLAIGDAAHAMSPVGGVGINLAIQDAVAAANALAAPLLRGENVDRALAQVQQRRLVPTRIVQGLQRMIHARVIGAALDPAATMAVPPLPVRLIDGSPMLRGLLARLIGLGIRRERVRSPCARLDAGSALG